MFKPLPDNLVGTAGNNTRYATEIVVSDNIYTSLTDIAGSWTYLCLVVGKELEVVKVIDLLGSNTIRIVRGVEGTKRLTLVGATVKYLPTVSSVYDILSTLPPIVIQGVEGVSVDGYSINYPQVTLQINLDGVGVVITGNSIGVIEDQGYIGCTPYKCPTLTKPKFILTSRPYPVDVLDGIGSIARYNSYWVHSWPAEAISGVAAFISGVVYGTLQTYTLEDEALVGTPEFNSGVVFEQLQSYTATTDALIGTAAFASGDIATLLIEYTMPPEGLISTPSFVSGTIA